MVENFRHHRAVQIVFVETPAAGSPAPLNRAKPPAYPHQRRESWQPQTRPPNKKAAAARRMVELLRTLSEREADARSMLKPRHDLMRAWFAKAA
jgi:hypothetical protein